MIKQLIMSFKSGWHAPYFADNMLLCCMLPFKGKKGTCALTAVEMTELLWLVGVFQPLCGLRTRRTFLCGWHPRCPCIHIASTLQGVTIHFNHQSIQQYSLFPLQRRPRPVRQPIGHPPGVRLPSSSVLRGRSACFHRRNVVWQCPGPGRRCVRDSARWQAALRAHQASHDRRRAAIHHVSGSINC